jgi:hypothetical protein
MRKLWLVLAVVCLGCGSPPTDVASSSSSASSSSAPPSFFALGDDVYHADERLAAEKQILRLVAQPRWFTGFPREVSREDYEAWMKQHAASQQLEATAGEPAYQLPSQPKYPKSIDELPQNEQGASLTLAVDATPQAIDAPSDDAITAETKPAEKAHVLTLALTLAAGDRAIQREIEHRRTNVLPFLFAFKVDGKPVMREPLGGVGEGGTQKFIELTPAKSQTTWTVRMAVDSLAALLPEDAQQIEVAAVFSERQHEGYSENGPVSVGEIWSTEALKNRPPQLVLRSNSVRLQKKDAQWIVERAE